MFSLKFKIFDENVEKILYKRNGKMYNETTQQNKVYLPTNDLNFKRLFASPQFMNISKGFLQDLAAYDPLGLLQITDIKIETPYNFQEINQLLSSEREKGLLITEVDYACVDENGLRFMLEMQKRDQAYLEERIVYNVGQKYAQYYALDSMTKEPKYTSLQPVIAVVILDENHFKDEIPIRFLRPHDTRFDLYKRNRNLGLEIYIELRKDISDLPRNLQLWMAYFRTGTAPKEAPNYIQEAIHVSSVTSMTKEERRLADLIERGEQKRLAEDHAARLKTAEQIEQGIKQGIEGGIERGIYQNKLETAKMMLQDGNKIELISKYTGLNEEEVLDLKKSSF